MKDSKEVIQDFNKLVNMSASELETWLKSKDSGEAGWPKEDNDGETVGHESGRKITEILKSNPSKDAEKYTEDQISHMRKVVAYCKRHLAQEEQSLKNKSESEAKKTKSYISLKNWGHDPLKKSDDKNTNKGSEEVNGKSSNGNNENGAKSSKENKTQDKKSSNNSKEEDDEQSENEAGDKRKRQDKGGAPEPKKHRTRSGSKDEKATSNKEADDESENDDEEEEKSNSKSDKGPKPGETVSWNWGNGQPKGKVLDVKEDKYVP
ncbi:hypothetical protein MY4824_004999 [Beauveria thailandica]